MTNEEAVGTECRIMTEAINAIFMRLTDMGLINDERLLMSNEDYKLILRKV